MKKIICLLLISSLVFTSCKKNFLDVQTQDKYASDLAYSSLSAVKALTVSLYRDMQVEDLSYVISTEALFPTQVTDESVRSYTWGGAANDGVLYDGQFGWWGYSSVRSVNDFLAKMPGAQASDITDDVKQRLIAEARFIRAFYYFSMVKRYGGVPIITEVQDPTKPVETLKVSRNTEKEVYDFIASELDAIIPNLPETYSDSKEAYRATKFAALALKSRAMLYAASIAKYGTVQLNGLVGINGSDANGYWQKAMDAAQQIMNSGAHSLYDGTDKVANFRNLFLTGDDLSNNKESIFVVAYSDPGRTHSFDFYNAPQSFKVDYGCVTNPTLELVEEFEYKDGSTGALKVKDAGDNPIFYSNPADLFKDKDPRFLASILYPNAPWQGSKVEIRRGIIDGADEVVADNLTDTYEDLITIVGKDGPMTVNDPTKTGFYIQKFMNPENRIEQDRSTTPWMVFRYGEVLLNYAEAAIELGKNAEAFSAIKQLRDRAGIETPFAAGELTRDMVRHERKVELAFENHRWWDIRRWRIADQLLNNTQFHALYPWLMWEAGKNPSEMKYTFEITDAPKNPRTFPSRLYYEQISPSEIAKNSSLIQNPGY